MKYPKLVTAAILMLTFAYIDSIQHEFFEKVANINPSETFMIAYLESTSESRDMPVCSSQATQYKCYVTEKESQVKKNVVNFFESVKQLTFTC